MRIQRRLTIALLLAGGLLAAMDAARFARQPKKAVRSNSAVQAIQLTNTAALR